MAWAWPYKVRLAATVPCAFEHLGSLACRTEGRS